MYEPPDDGEEESAFAEGWKELEDTSKESLTEFEFLETLTQGINKLDLSATFGMLALHFTYLMGRRKEFFGANTIPTEGTNPEDYE